MDVILGPLLTVLLMATDIYMWIIIIGVILTWLVHFNVVNTSNQFVSMVGNFCYRATEPALRPIRRIIPDLGGIDISPMVLILMIIFLQQVLYRLALSIG